MMNVNGVSYYCFELDENGYVKKQHVNMGYGNKRLVFPLSFDRDILEENMEIINEMRSTYIGDEQLSFNLTNNIQQSISCGQWQILLDFALENNINFRTSVREEYTPEEMKNYIDSFTKVENGVKKFVFDRETRSVPNNIFLDDTSNTESIFSDTNINISFFINNEFRNDFPNHARKCFDVCNCKMTFDLQNGKLLDEEAKEEILWRINYLKENYPEDKFDISFSTVDRYYTKEEFKKILEIEEWIKTNYDENYELKFSGNGKLYSKDQILNANSKIDRMVEKLKSSDLSPYEKVLFLRNILQEREFYQASNSNLSRDLYSVLNTRNIICVGYANLMDVILNELNDENIKSHSESLVQTAYNGSEEFHEINCIYIKDEKYGIEGYYNLDVNCYEGTYTQFMSPVKDVDGWYTAAYKNVIKATQLVNGNLSSGIMPIQENNGVGYTIQNKLKNKYNWREKVLDNTKAFLDTPMGREISDELGIDIKYDSDALGVINEIVDKTQPISMEITQKALQHVTESQYGVSAEEAKEYSKNKMIEGVFDSLFLLEREKCSCEFAKTSLEIESNHRENDRKMQYTR